MQKSPIDNRKDILLLLLWAKGATDKINEPINGRTRLVKAMFLFKEEVLQHFCKGTEITDKNFYSFFAWNFGPFSTQVYDDLTFFLLRGFIIAKVSTEEPLIESREEWEKYISDSEMSYTSNSTAFDEYEDESFSLTDKGINFVETNLLPKLSDAQLTTFHSFKKRVQAPLRAILRYVYEVYPDYTERSKIKAKVLANG